MTDMHDKRSKKLDVESPRLAKATIQPDARVVDDVHSIEVKLRNAPTWEQLRDFIPDIVMSTWANRSDEYDMTDEQKDCLIYRAMDGKFLPQALECINMVFSVDGVTSHDLTHILRTRTNTFIVECTGDSYKNGNDVSMPDAFTKLGLDDEFRDIVARQEWLYAKALNAGMAIQDARQVLPRTMHQFVIMRVPFNNLKAMAFQRLDKQIQPTSDWIWMGQMVLEACKQYEPFAVIASKFFDAPNRYYINESKTNFASKFFKPLKQNATEETESMQTVFGCTPEEAYGHQEATEELERIKQQVEAIAEKAKEHYPWIWSDENKELFK